MQKSVKEFTDYHNPDKYKIITLQKHWYQMGVTDADTKRSYGSTNGDQSHFHW